MYPFKSTTPLDVQYEKYKEIKEKREKIEAMQVEPWDRLYQSLDYTKAWNTLYHDITYSAYMNKFVHGTWVDTHQLYQFDNNDGYARYRDLMDYMQDLFSTYSVEYFPSPAFRKDNGQGTLRPTSHGYSMVGPLQAVYRYYHRYNFFLARTMFDPEGSDNCPNQIQVVWQMKPFGEGTIDLQFISSNNVAVRRCLNGAALYGYGMVGHMKGWGTRFTCMPVRFALTVILTKAQICMTKQREEMGFATYWAKRFQDTAPSIYMFPNVRNYQDEKTPGTSVISPVKICYDLWRDAIMDNLVEDAYNQVADTSLYPHCMVTYTMLLETDWPTRIIELGREKLDLMLVGRQLSMTNGQSQQIVGFDQIPSTAILTSTYLHLPMVIMVVADWLSEYLELESHLTTDAVEVPEGLLCNHAELKDLAHRFSWIDGGMGYPTNKCTRITSHWTEVDAMALQRAEYEVWTGHFRKLKALVAANTNDKDADQLLNIAYEVHGAMGLEVQSNRAARLLNEYFLALEAFADKMGNQGAGKLEVGHPYEDPNLAMNVLGYDWVKGKPKAMTMRDFVQKDLKQDIYKILQRFVMDSWTLDCEYLNKRLGIATGKVDRVAPGKHDYLVQLFASVSDAMITVSGLYLNITAQVDESTTNKYTIEQLMDYVQQCSCNYWLLGQTIDETWEFDLNPFAPLWLSINSTYEIHDAMRTDGIDYVVGYDSPPHLKQSNFRSASIGLANLMLPAFADIPPGRTDGKAMEVPWHWEFDSTSPAAMDDLEFVAFGTAYKDSRKRLARIAANANAGDTLGAELVFDSEYFEENKEQTIIYNNWAQNRITRRLTESRMTSESDAVYCPYLDKTRKPTDDRFLREIRSEMAIGNRDFILKDPTVDPELFIPSKPDFNPRTPVGSSLAEEAPLLKEAPTGSTYDNEAYKMTMHTDPSVTLGDVALTHWMGDNLEREHKGPAGPKAAKAKAPAAAHHAK